MEAARNAQSAQDGLKRGSAWTGGRSLTQFRIKPQEILVLDRVWSSFGGEIEAAWVSAWALEMERIKAVYMAHSFLP